MENAFRSVPFRFTLASSFFKEKKRKEKKRKEKKRKEKKRKENTGQDKTRQDKTRQDRTRQDADNSPGNKLLGLSCATPLLVIIYPKCLDSRPTRTFGYLEK
jgi:Flp pilus assembly protein TadB